jgi:hypothetical protein
MFDDRSQPAAAAAAVAVPVNAAEEQASLE